MKNLKSKFIVFLSALIVFISVPSVRTYASYSGNYFAIRFSVPCYIYYIDEYFDSRYSDVIYDGLEYSSTPYHTFNIRGNNYSSHYRKLGYFFSDYYSVHNRDSNPYVRVPSVFYSLSCNYLGTYNGTIVNDGAGYVINLSTSYHVSVSPSVSTLFFEVSSSDGGYVDLNSLDIVSSNSTSIGGNLVLNDFIYTFSGSNPNETPEPSPSSTPDPDDPLTPTPEPTYFPFVTPAPENIYQPVDSPIGDVGSSYGYSSSTGQNSGSSGNYQPTFSNSHLKISLYLNSEFITTQTVDVGSYLEPPVTSLGILSLYGATYYKYGDNIYVNLGDNVYQFLEWKFYLRNGTTPNNTFGSSSYMPISTSLFGSRFYIAPVYETFYYDSFTGQKKFISQPNFDSSYYATLTVDIKLVLVEGEIYDPPSNPSGSDDPYINPDYKPLIPPKDPTLNNPSSPPLSDGSSSLSNNTTGQGFDINHYLNFQFPTVLAYLGFLFTQSFNYLADNSIIVFSAIVVIVVASIFLIIRERL